MTYTLKLGTAALLFACATASQSAMAAGPKPSKLEQSLAKLAPEERAHEACALKGLEALRKDAKLRKADRIKSSMKKPAKLDGATLVAKDGAVRVGKQWFAMSFTCKLSPDYMKAETFTFQLGPEIPKDRWEDLQLWG